MSKGMGKQSGYINISNNSDKFKEASEEALKKIAEEVGLKAAEYAQMLAPVDTGLLRNSIGYALSGETPSLGAAGGGKQKRTYKADNPDKDGVIQKGTYSGHVPSAKANGLAVYVGSAVEYAPFVECGTRKSKAQPFLRPAVENHADEYRTIAESVLKGG